MALVDASSADFSDLGVQLGDLVENLSDGSGGLVSSLSTNSLTVARLHGGTTNSFADSDAYQIHLTGVLSAPADGAASVSIVDRGDGAGVGGASVTIPAAGSPEGAIHLTGLHMDLEVELDPDPPTDPPTPYELPLWFTHNNWHRLIYVAAVSGVLPGPGIVCAPGSDCLTVTGVATPDDDKELLLIAAGAPLATQDRTVGTACGAIEPAYFCDYFEGENADFDFDESGPPPPTFEQADLTKTFNDTVRVLEP